MSEWMNGLRQSTSPHQSTGSGWLAGDQTSSLGLEVNEDAVQPEPGLTA